MIRTLLTKILPLLVPAALFLLWMWRARRRAAANGGKRPPLREAPWVWMAFAGLAVLAAGLVFFRFSTGEPPGGTYVPPHLEDGEVVPGRVVR